MRRHGDDDDDDDAVGDLAWLGLQGRLSIEADGPQHAGLPLCGYFFGSTFPHQLEFLPSSHLAALLLDAIGMD